MQTQSILIIDAQPYSFQADESKEVYGIRYFRDLPQAM